MDFKELFNRKNSIRFVVVLGLMGIALIGLSDFFGSNSKNTSNVETSEIMNDDDYCTNLEIEAEELIKSVTGDKNVKVVITLESGIEYLYASDKNINTDSKKNISGEDILNDEISDKTEESFIIIKTSEGEQPLLISALSPKIRGAAVVCDSGSVQQIADIIKDSLSTLLDISESKISVAGGVHPGNEEIK